MKVYELFDTPEKWTKGAYARNENGIPCNMSNPDAVSFCVSGAMVKCNYDNSEELIKAYKKLNAFLIKKGVQSQDNISESNAYDIVKWNDDPKLTYEEVIKVLKEVNI